MRLTAGNSALLIIDIQEKLLPVISGNKELVENAKKIIQGAKVLNLPVILTEQYPKGLGNTVKEISDELSEYIMIEKQSFSCCKADSFIDKLRKTGRDHVLVCGIETHICVYQTCLDLLDEGFSIQVLQDCVSSRKIENKELALDKIVRMGGELTSVEMALFEMLGSAKGEPFRAISKIVK